MRIKIFLFFILVTANSILAQDFDKAVLKGKINANVIDLEGVYVINLKTEKSAITEKEGFFSIAAIPGDTLLFSAIHLKEVRIVLEQKDFQQELFQVNMESMITQLNEVIVKRYDNINAVALGISPRGIKQLTQAERHLKTANSTSGDALLNMMSGRMAMLKKELEVENKVSFMSQIENMFNEDYFRKTLKIPFEYVKGFLYYIVENENFTSVLKSKNKTSIEFLLVELAEKYNEMISAQK